MATKPEPLFCDDEDDCDVVDADVFAVVLAVVLAVLPVFVDVVADTEAEPFVLLVSLVLCGKPPANAFDALTATAPTILKTYTA